MLFRTSLIEKYCWGSVLQNRDYDCALLYFEHTLSFPGRSSVKQSMLIAGDRIEVKSLILQFAFSVVNHFTPTLLKRR